MKSIIQIGLLIKRILCKPFMIVVLLLIPLSMLAVSLFPDKSQSTEIVSGIFIEEPDQHTECFVSPM